jgi:hypothetical protein
MALRGKRYLAAAAAGLLKTCLRNPEQFRAMLVAATRYGARTSSRGRKGPWSKLRPGDQKEEAAMS